MLHDSPDSSSWRPCRRAQVVLLLLLDNEDADWRSFIDGRELSEEEVAEMNHVLVGFCKSLKDEAQGKLQLIDEAEQRSNAEQMVMSEKVEKKMPNSAKATLKMRWSQIKAVSMQIVEDLDEKGNYLDDP